MSNINPFENLSLGIVCPLANEKNTAEKFIREVLDICRRYSFRSISFYAILDRASKDGTLEILRNLNIKELKVIYAPENKNVVDAYKKGYNEALANDDDWILEIDGGYSHLPNQMSSFFEIMISRQYDCVFGSRFCNGGKFENGSFKRLLFSLGGTWVVNLLLGTKLSDMTSGFELFTKESLSLILKKGINSQGPFFQTEIRVFAHRFKIVEVPITFNAATGHLHSKALMDAFDNLKRLFLLRFRGQLNQ